MFLWVEVEVEVEAEAEGAAAAVDAAVTPLEGVDALVLVATFGEAVPRGTDFTKCNTNLSLIPKNGVGEVN
jgi:hypothetical protein